MFKKTWTVIIAVILVTLLASSVALADEKVTLELDLVVGCPGDSITASGTAKIGEWISIKILDCGGTIVFFDATKSDAKGNYSLTFNMPKLGTLPDILTVVAGYGTNVATGEITVSNDPVETRDVKLVADLADVKVAYGTTQKNIGLPGQVEVTLQDDSKIKMGVNWDNGTPAYDGNKAGEYIFAGTLVQTANITNTLNKKADIKVIVAQETTQAPGGGGGGGSVGSAPLEGTEVKIDKGGQVDKHGAEITIPVGAFARDLIIKIAKVDDYSGLPLPKDGWLISEVLEITKDEKGDFTKAVTITMTFDKSKIDSKAEIALYYYDPALKAWIKLDNIKVDWEKGTVSGEINHFTKFAVIAAGPEGKPDTPLPSVSTTLTDIAGHWAIDSIKTLLQKGAITGYPDQSFKPNNNITRAEFATVLVKAFNLEPGTGKNFDDTADHWAKNEIATAAAHGIVSGYSATAFGPNDNITREQMAVMIVKAAELSQTSAAPSFNDSNNIADWAEQSVAAASAAGIIKGYPDNTFLPQGQATRAEAATVIVKALE